MLNFTPADIRLGVTVSSREEAIRAVAALLAERQSIEPAYVDSMLRREKTANTYLGNGVAIPHGQPQDAALIRETRIAMLQVPAGVAWKGDEKARLIFGIAAKSDEHISLLVRLTSLTADAALADRLATTTDAAEIVAAILADPDNTDAASADDYDGAHIRVKFTNPRGFHLRPATQLAEATATMDGNITLVVNGREADARSALSIVKLGITTGSTIEVRADSPYAEDHLRQLRRHLELINDEPQEAAASEDDNIDWQPASSTTVANTIAGTMAAPGIAVGPIFHWSLGVGKTAARQRGDEAAERSALKVAVENAADTLRALADDEHMNKVQRNLFSAHVALITDTETLDEALAKIGEGSDALSAWDSVIAARVAKLEALTDAHLAQRAVDL
ncbi:MAG: HPr family phosphocarrier protein, partial [Verrucomicrobiota bacterium]